MISFTSPKRIAYTGIEAPIIMEANNPTVMYIHSGLFVCKILHELGSGRFSSSSKTDSWKKQPYSIEHDGFFYTI